MTAKPALLLLSLVLLGVFGWLVIDRVSFINHARRTEGRVTRVYGEEVRCGKRNNRCTSFTAVVEYRTPGSTQVMKVEVDAGLSYGRDQPAHKARHQYGDVIRVAYDPRKPAVAYEDTFWGICATPLKVLFFQVMSLFQGLPERRPRHHSYG